MDEPFVGAGDVQLSPGLFQNRFDLNRAYVESLKSEDLLQNHYFEAGLRGGCIDTTDPSEGVQHGGWETPSCQVRGHFLGHWISAAARQFQTTGNMETKARVDYVIDELEACQQRNGGGWVFSIPEKYLYWVAAGFRVAVPHYIVHKTLMGLFDAYKYAGCEKALTILDSASDWFHRWTKEFSREKMDDILDLETGGMLEVWAELYGVTGKTKHLDLIERYTRARLFDRLLESKDALTNMHANTTIPEIQGAARAYEVTGESRWRSIVEKYWECAVETRGTYCTGGQTSGEVWTPPYEFAARRGDKNQEHCTVYNMIRLADFLFRWTGDARYADYIERNIYNGILAQQNVNTGMVSYFLPLEAGGRKKWGTPTKDFWCCHGTLVQAHTAHTAYIHHTRGKSLLISQFIPSRLTATIDQSNVTVDMAFDNQGSGAAPDNSSAAGSRHRPESWVVRLEVTCDVPTKIDLSIRIPWWVADRPVLTVNDEPHAVEAPASGYCTISRVWHNDSIRLELPKRLGTLSIPDEPDTVAFHDGPVVLAGLCDKEFTLHGDKSAPDSILVPDNERKHGRWLSGYRTKGQEVGIKFKPLHEVVDEPFTVYFPIVP